MTMRLAGPETDSGSQMTAGDAAGRTAVA